METKNGVRADKYDAALIGGFAAIAGIVMIGLHWLFG